MLCVYCHNLHTTFSVDLHGVIWRSWHSHRLGLLALCDSFYMFVCVECVKLLLLCVHLFFFLCGFISFSSCVEMFKTGPTVEEQVVLQVLQRIS